MSLSSPSGGSIPTLPTSPSSSVGSEGEPSVLNGVGENHRKSKAQATSQPLSVVGGNQREGSMAAVEEGSFLSTAGFSPIQNMELYPPRSRVVGEFLKGFSEDC